jgi:hypothetical protein
MLVPLGIEKGNPFTPTDRQKRFLEAAATMANQMVWRSRLPTATHAAAGHREGDVNANSQLTTACSGRRCAPPLMLSVMAKAKAKARAGSIVRGALVIIGILLLFTVPAVLISQCTSRSASRLFGNTTSITFTEIGIGQPNKSLTVTDQAEVERIVGTIRLQSKELCPCAHRHFAFFQKPGGAVGVSFCDHCFNVGAKHYEMPKEFYAEFRRLVLSRTNEVWEVQP